MLNFTHIDVSRGLLSSTFFISSFVILSMKDILDCRTLLTTYFIQAQRNYFKFKSFKSSFMTQRGEN